MKFLGTLKTFSTLQLAIAASIAVHAILLSIRFVDPESFNRVFEDTPLEVILVNARSNERPDKAQAIAQSSLAGGGDAEKGRATSPLPPSALTDLGEAADELTANKLQSLSDQQNILLAQIKSQLAALRPPDAAHPESKPEQIEREEKRRQLVKTLAEIERRINEENARPKKRYISPAVREEVYATYYANLRHAVEGKGTENFPQLAGKKLYGELTMIVTVNHDGTVLATEVVSSSGNRTLDRQAAVIVRSAAPFGVFAPAMRRQADQIVVVSRFKFTRDATLETVATQR